MIFLYPFFGGDLTADINIDFTLKDNSDEVLMELAYACMRALERCGMQAEGYAKDLAPVDTGNLRNSITHEVDGNTVYIGTAVEYAPYVELGTAGRLNEGGQALYNEVIKYVRNK